MSVTAGKRALSAGLAHIEHVAGAYKGGVSGTRGQVLVRATQDGLTLAAHHELRLTVQVPADVPFMQEDRALVLPAALLAQHVRNAPAEVVELEFLDHALRLRGGGAHTETQVQPDAPSPAAFSTHYVNEGTLLAVQADELTTAAQAILYAASHEAFQAVFRGVLFEAHDAGLRLVASDGYRIATAELPTPPYQPFRAIVGAGHVRELLRLVAGRGAVSLQFSASHLTVRAEGLSCALPLQDGEYPDYRRAMPAPVAHFTLPVAELKAAMTRAAIMSDRNSNNRVELVRVDSDLTVSASGDYGSMTERLALAGVEGDPPGLIPVNARFLLEALTPMTGTLKLAFAGAGKPFILTSDAPGIQGVLVTLRA